MASLGDKLIILYACHDTVYVKIFVVDLISLFSWLASIHENFSLSEVSPTKFFPANFLFRLGTCHQTDSAVPDLHSNIYLPAYCDDNNDQIATS